MEKFLKGQTNKDISFLEYPLAVLVQSGTKFNVNKFGIESNNDQLNPNCVYINVCSKFCDMTAMASRTLLVNPNDIQKKAYEAAYHALITCYNNL